MTATYRTIPNPVYIIYTLSKYGNQQPNTFSQNYTMYIHMFQYTNSKCFLTKYYYLLTALVQIVRRILIYPSVLRTCTWKIVFKIENNDLNELSECMFYKTFCFSEKHLKNVKLSFTIIFQKLFFAFQVSKTFLCLLAFVLACF